MVCSCYLVCWKTEKVDIKFGGLVKNAYLRQQNRYVLLMSNWYDKYLSIYGKPFSEVPQDIIEGTRLRLAALQSDHPIASIVVIAYNEETHLQACLWAISEIKCKYPVEILGVDNDSKDRTAEIFEKSGIPYYTEYQHSCGYARRCGLHHSRGKYYFDVDSDTIYPPMYYELMLQQLMKPGIVAVSATWSYFPDANHSKLGLKLFEICRDLFLWIQHFKRPELSVRGLVFAYNADYGRQEEYRVDIIRGEDGSMALSLKKYGKIKFVHDSRCRAITGYGTIGNQSMWQSFLQHVRIQGKGLSRIFYKKDHYEDNKDNLINNR
ncbi:Glycosyl transferase family 2 [Xylanibacter ruminicola]|uniref:Glycosyl transferase family 2 n=2 Tax=Xylanibacter ruminicola TaxID=839 RepID=A0A1M7GT01_XYLRU|nr:Glycosyl transferase family 2 [Xylanibacter ruminicola]